MTARSIFSYIIVCFVLGPATIVAFGWALEQITDYVTP